MTSAATSNKSAFESAVDMLSRAEYSKNRLMAKLARKGYEEEEIESAIQRLEELRYLNDGEAVKSQFKFLYDESKNSVREIKYKLLRKGFSAEDVESAAEDADEERELTAALKALRIKYRKKKEPDKMRGYLYRHGFTSGVCYAAVNEFMESE